MIFGTKLMQLANLQFVKKSYLNSVLDVKHMKCNGKWKIVEKRQQ